MAIILDIFVERGNLFYVRMVIPKGAFAKKKTGGRV